MKHYISIARPDHWFKNIFALPGFILAFIWQPIDLSQALLGLFWGGVSLCAAASANYTINEYLDAGLDRYHPTKKNRPSAQGLVQGKLVAVQYVVLAGVSLGLAYWSQSQLFVFSIAFLMIMGVIYNVKPFRTKDRLYIDVLSEALNNPIRFLVGWAIVVPNAFPPSSILISYWFGGAFLMAVKRYAEYKQIGDGQAAAKYRSSFKKYDLNRLLLSAFFYAINAVFFLAIFLIKYRIEFLLSYPLFALLFTWYLSIGLGHDSIAQRPEKLLAEKAFMSFVIILSIVVVILYFVDIPSLQLLQKVLEF